MGSRDISENVQKEDVRSRGRQHGVLITVYVESPTSRSQKLTDRSKKPHDLQHTGKSGIARTRGSDRRAQLLAYSQQLRNSRSEESQVPTMNSSTSRPTPRPKLKCTWFTLLGNICIPKIREIPRPGSKWKYHRMVWRENEHINESDKSKSRTASGRKHFEFTRRLRNMMRRISCKEITV